VKIGIISDILNRPSLTGVGNYTYNLIKALSKINKKDIYLIDYKNNELFQEMNKIIIKNPIEDFFKKSYYFWHLYLNYKFSRKKIDLNIIHSPEGTLFTELKHYKKIITAYDVMPYLFPEKFTKIMYIRFKYIFPKTLKTADKIIAVSHNTKRDLIKYFEIPEDKIRVIYGAVNENYKPLKENEINKIKEKHGLIYPFILYVGGLAPNKNVMTLINAFYKLKKHGFDNYKLIVAGVKKWKYKNVFETIEKLNLQKDVVFAGYVLGEDLSLLYNAADLFVYPSLYEGFGLPPLEAMACGTPVITSNTSSLPEVVGDAGIMVNPYDANELADKMCKVLTNEDLKKELSKKGLKRAKLFSWEKCARETLEVYKEV